jgi:cell division protein ZapA (FtsZ GTPase activity inhibitor)
LNSQKLDERMKAGVKDELERRTIDYVLDNAISFVNKNYGDEDGSKLRDITRIFDDKVFEIEQNSKLIQTDKMRKLHESQAAKKVKEEEKMKAQREKIEIETAKKKDLAAKKKDLPSKVSRIESPAPKSRRDLAAKKASPAPAKKPA